MKLHLVCPIIFCLQVHNLIHWTITGLLFSVIFGESSRTIRTPGGETITVVSYTPNDDVRPINLNTPIQVFELVEVSEVDV